jgi:hypothetical protein
LLSAHSRQLQPASLRLQAAAACYGLRPPFASLAHSQAISAAQKIISPQKSKKKQLWSISKAVFLLHNSQKLSK